VQPQTSWSTYINLGCCSLIPSPARVLELSCKCEQAWFNYSPNKVSGSTSGLAFVGPFGTVERSTPYCTEYPDDQKTARSTIFTDDLFTPVREHVWCGSPDPPIITLLDRIWTDKETWSDNVATKSVTETYRLGTMTKKHSPGLGVDRSWNKEEAGQSDLRSSFIPTTLREL
jgi:hypothetical protein